MTISITLTNKIPPSSHFFKTNLYLNSVALILVLLFFFLKIIIIILHDFSQVPSDISSKDEQSVNEVFPFHLFILFFY